MSKKNIHSLYYIHHQRIQRYYPVESIPKGNTHINIRNLIPIPNTSSNKFGEKAVKICSANTLARDLDILKKFSETK